MKEILERACTDLIAAIRDRVSAIQSAEIVPGPPDRAAAYPAIAILCEPFTLTTQAIGEVNDESGNPIVMHGNQALVEIGALRGSIRIFCATRLPAQRSRICDDITRVFFQDDEAPSRVLLSLDDVEVGGIATGATWPVAFLLDDVEWTDEMVFSEKRWAWMRCDVDVPILTILDKAPLVTSMVVALSAQVSSPQLGAPTAITSPSQVATLSPLTKATVNADGTVGPHP